MQAVQKSHDWLVEHYRTIGGSNAAAAIGKSPYLSRRKLWARMVAAYHDGMPTITEPTPAMRAGVVYEPIARELLAERVGAEVCPPDDAAIYNDACPHAHTRPDGWLRCADGRIPVEIKCVHPATMARLRRSGVPEHWTIQCWHHCPIVVADCCVFCAMDVLDPAPESLLVQFVRPTASQMDGLMTAEAEFYGYVLRKEPPPDDEPQEELPPADGSEIAVLEDDAAATAARRIVEFAELKSEVDEALSMAKDDLVRLAGDEAEVIEVPGRIRVYRRQQAGRRTLDKEAVLRDFPQIADDPKFWKTGRPFRPFRWYKVEKE